MSRYCTRLRLCSELVSMQRTFEFTVPFSYVDLNGHMNNARYFDLAEDTIPAAAEGRALLEARVAYAAEAALGEQLTVQIGQAGQTYYLSGTAKKTCFRMSLAYEELAGSCLSACG